MKKILLLLVLFLGITISGNTLAQEDMLPEEETLEIICNTHYEIIGNQTPFLNQEEAYNIHSGGVLTTGLNSQFTLLQNEKQIAKEKSDFFFYNFKTTGEYILQAQIKNDSCEYNIELPIRSYQKAITYIGDEQEEFQLGFDENFKKDDILLGRIIYSDKKGSSEEDLQKLKTEINLINNSDIVIIKSKKFDQILQQYTDFLKNGEIINEPKQIFIITNNNPNFLKRSLSNYAQDLNENKVSILRDSDFVRLLSDLSFQRNIEEQSYITPFSIDFKNSPKYYIISFLVDQSISQNVPVQLIGLILVMALAALLVSILRQVIGFSVFGVYQPLLLGLSIYIIGRETGVFLFIIAIISTIIVRLFTKNFYLLHSAKVSLLIITYFIILLFGLRIQQYIGGELIDKSVFLNPYSIFPIFFVILVADKLFNEGFKFSSKARRISFLEFIIVTTMVYGLLEWQTLRNFMLSYPETILLVLIINIFVGRFSGLQLLEYFRFMPLIKKHLDDEEE